jgi:hypothetical protein
MLTAIQFAIAGDISTTFPVLSILNDVPIPKLPATYQPAFVSMYGAENIGVLQR